MSDTQDPLQDLVEQLIRKRARPAPDKKIVFGVRKPTAATVDLMGIPSIIEAPFPSERTLHWNPGFSDQEVKINERQVESADSPDDESKPLTENVGHEEQESAFLERTPPPATPSPETAGNTAVIVSQEVLLKVNEHVSQSLDRELGGFLLGNRYHCPNTQRDYVIIDQYSPAKFTE
jgi:hypothetical protein